MRGYTPPRQLSGKAHFSARNANKTYLQPTMRTGQELILATKRFEQDNSLRSWWCILSTALLLLAALAGTIWNFHLAARAACSVLTGFLILRLFVIYHDQQHHAILPRSWMAEAFMRVFGILALS